MDPGSRWLGMVVVSIDWWTEPKCFQIELVSVWSLCICMFVKWNSRVMWYVPVELVVGTDWFLAVVPHRRMDCRLALAVQQLEHWSIDLSSLILNFRPKTIVVFLFVALAKRNWAGPSRRAMMLHNWKSNSISKGIQEKQSGSDIQLLLLLLMICPVDDFVRFDITSNSSLSELGVVWAPIGDGRAWKTTKTFTVRFCFFIT